MFFHYFWGGGEEGRVEVALDGEGGEGGAELGHIGGPIDAEDLGSSF